MLDCPPLIITLGFPSMPILDASRIQERLMKIEPISGTPRVWIEPGALPTAWIEFDQPFCWKPTEHPTLFNHYIEVITFNKPFSDLEVHGNGGQGNNAYENFY
jgi:hypothetical protein